MTRQGTNLRSIEILVVGDVHELGSFATQAQFISFGHPSRLVLAEDVQQTRLGELGGGLGLQVDEGVDGIVVQLQGLEDRRVDDMVRSWLGENVLGVDGWSRGGEAQESRAREQQEAGGVRSEHRGASSSLQSLLLKSKLVPIRGTQSRVS